uniref:Polycystic kidney disease 1a n=1 Tax=Denticeps clupeoides TaxID=299321 RepID=A0AAY4DRE1_9TELE
VGSKWDLNLGLLVHRSCLVVLLSLCSDLSSNPLECDCSLYRLVSWLQERGVHVRRPSAMLCHQPAKVSGQPLLNVSLLTCGLNYAGCLQDEHIGGRELVIFTSSTEGNFSREQCNSLCFFEAQRYGGLGEQGECLCSTNSEPNLLSESQCSAACADPQVMKKCGWTVAPDVFQVGLTALFSSSRTSVNSKAVLSVSSSVSPINLFWHFGDQSPQLNTSTPYTIAEHKYALPGHYQARVRVCAAHKEFTASGKVSVTLPPRLELQCPSMVVANQSLVTTLVNWGGVGAEVDWEVLRERDVVKKQFNVFFNCIHIYCMFCKSVYTVTGPFVRVSVVKMSCTLTTCSWFKNLNRHFSIDPHLFYLHVGCGELCAPIAICQTPDEPFNQTAFRPPSCPPQQQWCPFQRNCLPLSQPCHSTSCFNCSQVDPLPAITVPPIYSLLSEVMFILPPGASTHQLDLLISPGDFIALQHDAGPGSFLHCSRDSSSPWRQSIQVLNSSCWIGNNSILGEADDKQWLHDRVCLLRVLHVGQNKTTLKGSLFSAGLPHPGDYSLEVTSNDPDFPVKASCPIHVVPPLGLSVVYPYRQNGTVFFRPNQTSLLVTVQSQHTAVVRWQGSNETFHFQSSCPLEFVSQVVECREPDHKNQTWFALVDLQLIETADQVLVELTAENEVTTDILTIPAKVELPLWGLQVHPHPNCRVLVSSLAVRHFISVQFTVAGGTNPTFKWIVDDKSFYTYYNSNFNVIYKNAASYKLTVIAMNHVSNLTEDFIVSVGRMNPMSNITVSGVPSIVTQGSNLTLSVNFSMDISVNATIRWSFGDGGYKVHYIPPHDYLSHYPEFQDQVELTEKIYYVYEQPGVYTLLVSVSNCYENKTQKMDVYVFSILKWEVTINTEPSMLKAGRPAEFEADPGPSPYGIVYTWDFGDNTTKLQGRERRVSHTYINGGVYSVCVSVNNTISSTGNCTNMMVYEEINCLEVMSSAPTELNTPTVITAHLESGNNITWTFDMGDGNVLIGTEPHVRHTYMKDGNYTVNVTATNPVSSQSKFITVQIFVLHVRWLEPTGCIQEDTEVQFHAFVSGNASAYMYEWSFGDGTLNSTGSGTPGILHSYSASGEYLLSLLLSSGVNKVNFYTWICVQPAVTNVSIVPISSHIRLGDEGKFRVIALPEFNYNYIWDFGTDDSQGALHGEEEITFTYRNPGQYLVMVTVWNNISSSNDSVLIEVQKPVGPLMIQHNSSRGSNLAVHQIYMFTASLDSTDVRYFWDFGDGNVLTGRNVTHAYNSSGNFNIHLLGSNAVSNNSSNVVVSVLAPIQGLFINASQVNVPLNISVHFEALKDQGDRVRFSWILCDHCTSIPGSHTMFYTFRSVGTFNVIVTAKNEINTAQANILIFVQRELEGLQIIAEELGERCCYSTNKVLHLQASLREGTNMSFNWNVLKEHDITTVMNFSGRSTELNFSHPGLCEVILKATNLLGQLVVNKTIQFLDPIDDLSLNISPNPVAVNHNAKMTVFASIGSDLRYSWSVDGVLLSQMNNYVPHRFISPGMKHIQANVSNEISNKSISLWVSVQEPITGIRFTASNVTETNFVASGDNITFQGAIQTGTNVSWAWLLPSGTKTGQSITSYSFSNAGMFLITLNASNDVSEKTVSQNFTVQNRIQGLDLKASKSFVALGENVEFTFSIMSGTSVNFILSISGDATVELQNQTYVHQFSRVDTYIVNLTAHNQVSSERKHLQVEVMEPVSRLTIVDCCKGAIPVGVTKTFIAEIHTGNPVTFLWTFDLRHDPDKTSFFGKEVTYTPKDPGTLTIFLRAFNSLHGQNITKIIQVQNVLTSATLEAQPNDTFINKEVVFRVTLGPRYTSAAYHWDFGDGTTVTSNSPSSSFTLSHIYTQPGLYLVRVNASNLVSFILAQVEVNIRVLECEEPEVQVIQAPKLSVWRYQSVLLEANVDLKGCAHYGVQYLWDIFSTPHCHEGKQGSSSRVRLPSELDMHKIQLSVPKMSLRAGNYSIVFSLSYEGVPLRKAACLQLSVMSGRLVPIIEGGTYRVWSKTQDLQLSAEQSYDPNLNLESQSLLTYHWECENTSKGPAHCSTLNFGLGSSGPVLGISGSELEADVEYTFRLTVSKEGMPSESTVQTVLVQSGRIPIVLLECVSCKAQSIYEVSQNSKVYLAGTCSNCQSSHRGRWTAMTQQNETLVLDSTTTTTGSEGMRLVLRQGILRDFESYIFSLRVTDDTMDREGVAYIMLRPNKPPSGGSCSLWASVAGTRVRSLQDKVHFNCTGYTDLDDSPTPLLYSLLVMRCTGSFCEEFCVYKGTSPEHATYLPSGFHSALNRVVVSVTVEDHQGASIIALNKSVVLPEVDNNYSSLPHYLSNLTETRLQNLLKQGDSQGVRELSLALITVLNEYEQTRPSAVVTRAERQYRVSVRGNITRALTSLDLNTVNDIQQTSAALAQCTAVSREFVCEECQNSTLNKLESMLEILQTDTKQGTVTPTEIADNILNIMGDLIHQVSQAAAAGIPSDSEDHHHPLRVAAKAYTLSSELMRILMHSRVLNEEPLILRGAEIAAAGKRADPQSLLCYDSSSSPECQRFSIPRTFNTSLRTGVVQLLFQVEPNPFPFNYVANYTVSTEVASMEFRTENGTQIPISGLDENQAITVAVNNGTGAGLDGVGRPAGSVNVSRCSHVIVRVDTGNSNRQAGIYIQLNLTVVEDGSEEREPDPAIMAYLHSSDWPNEYNCSDRKHISLSMTRGKDLDHRRYTFFVSPVSHDTTLVYYINVTTGCAPNYPALIRLEAGVFSSLCQYFSESAKLWRTDGMAPLAETNASRAVCSTRHLTAFAASLFVPPDAVEFITPVSATVVLSCLVGLICYAVAAAILNKLDRLELKRAAVVPLCGKDGLHKYEVQVKTGWSRGAGTTAHIGISLYGRESRSGHRHLDTIGAFARNNLDIFRIATDTNLGNIWKIRIWHDNKGLSPAWFLQYVLVKDLQSGNSYFFLVEEWLSVDNENTDGRVEIEVEASEAELLDWRRLLSWELQRALCDSHIWLSLWERPRRSPFSGLQRATCCASLLSLSLLANAVWYATVTHGNSSTAVSHLVSLNSETLGVGLVSCLVVYPLYLLTFCLFRLSRSKVRHTLVKVKSKSALFFCSPSVLVVTDVCKPRPLPPWCGRVTLWGNWAGLLLSSSLTMWLGRSMNGGVALMWLISCMASFLSSFCLLEPLKVLCEGLYFALVVGRLRAEQQDVLVELPRVKRMLQRVPRLRPPQGFALAQAREEARKVRMLHNTLKVRCVLVMVKSRGCILLCAQCAVLQCITMTITSPSFLPPLLSSRDTLWTWLSGYLLPQLLDGPTLMYQTGSLLLGTPRLRQIRAPTGEKTGVERVKCAGSIILKRDQMISDMSWQSIYIHPPDLLSCICLCRVWHWGQVWVYGSGGFVQELSQSLEVSRGLLQNLQKKQWLDPQTRAVFVEFSLYNTNTDLLSVLTFLLEFSGSERALSSLDLKTCRLHRLSQGLDLPLLLTVLLLAFGVVFCVWQGFTVLREGRGYFSRTWNSAGVLSLVLALLVVTLHLSTSALADRQWALLLLQRRSYTSFYGVVQQSQVLTVLMALLLFLLVLKASHQLRFLREWAVFGRALRHSAPDLLALFHSVLEEYGSVGSACLYLLAVGGRGLPLHPAGSAPFSGPSLAFHTSFAVLRLGLLWVVTSALLRNYQRARAELYQPAVEMQDYEMVELFLRRLKMWMGLSRVKEFRHNVHFEGMELPRSRSSSTSDCKSLCLPPLDNPEPPPTPDSIDGGSESSWRLASSSPCSLVDTVGLGQAVVVGGSAWRERAETEATLRRVLPTFEALLQQLDRVTQATEELYQTECWLEQAQRRSRSRSWGHERSGGAQRKNSRGDSAGQRRQHHQFPQHKRDPQKPSGTQKCKSARKDKGTSKPDSAPLTPTPPKPCEWSPPTLDSNPPSSLFRHPAHTTTIPTRKRKHKAPPLKNKVHPNPDRPVSGHLKP